MPIILRSRILVLFANFALVACASLVPRINNQNGFQLDPLENGYHLSVQQADRASFRDETVQEVSPGELEVNGAINQVFKNPPGSLVVTYKAGRNGYVAKYSYSNGPPTPPPVFPFFLSAKSLMAVTG